MRKVLLALLVLLTGATTAAAQATGTITGVVSDQSELVIPGVTIEATNTATNQTRRAVTGADGFYTVPLLQPGSYTVKATLAGFRTTSREGVQVTVESSARVDLRLAVASLEETIVITEQPPLVETSNSQLGIVVNEKQIVELPLNGRNFTQLGTLLPGVVAAPGALGGATGDATPGGFG